MSTIKIILVFLVVGILIIAGATAIAAIMGSQRGKTEKWLRNGFVYSSGAVLIVAVLVGSIAAIHALNHIELDDSAETQQLASASFDATGKKVSIGAVAQNTPEPGTVITNETPTPITGVNYGAEYGVETCNDYVYFTETAEVYTGPGTEYESIGSVTAGGTLSRVGTVDGWSLIDYNGNFGFVSDDSLIQTQ